MCNQRETFGNLNILKFGGAVIISFFLHYNNQFLIQISSGGWPFKEIGYLSINYGQYVTELFFVISGFLFINTSYWKIKNKRLSFDNFLKKKLLRLYPLLFVTTLCSYILKLIQLITVQSNFPWFKVSLTDLMLDLVFGSKVLWNGVAVNGPGWYVTVLFICYAIAFFLAKTESKFVFFAPVAIGLVGCEYKDFIPSGIWCISRGFTAFFAGCLIAFIFHQKIIENKGVAKISSAIFLIIGIIILRFDAEGRWITNYTVYGCMMFFPEIIILTNNRFINRIGNSKIGCWLSEISFHVFLWNFPLISVFTTLTIKLHLDYNLGKYGLWLCFIFVSLLLGEISLVCDRKIRKFIRAKAEFGKV